jgi:LysM repeat protein
MASILYETRYSHYFSGNGAARNLRAETEPLTRVFLINVVSTNKGQFPGLDKGVLLMRDYIVQKGDMLSGIAQKLLGDGDRWPEIAKLNNLANSDLLFVGQILKIPNAGKSNSGTSGQSQSKPILSDHGAGHGPQLPASLALARGFRFIIFEQLPEVGSGKIIRKVAAVPRSFALQSKNPSGNISIAEHVLDINPSQSPFLSSSNRPFGAPTIEGTPLLLDVNKIRQAGGQIYTVEEVVADLRRFHAQNPHSFGNIPRLIETIEKIEGEVLIKGDTPPGSGSRLSAPHNAYVKSAERLLQEHKQGRLTRPQLIQELSKLESAYAKARVVGRVGRVLGVIGVILTAADVARASQQSLDQGSLKPLGAEVVRQVGGWGVLSLARKLASVSALYLVSKPVLEPL